ncbi:MAG: aromatic ring-hydroxylating oxygenase subunit alpha [Steroidobacteraceae bacterium]
MASIAIDKPGAALADGTPIASLVNGRTGRVSRRIHNDAEIFELEQERIFRRAWCYLAHESEIADPGDFVTRLLAGESVVIVRGDDGAIRGFLNACRHRGNRVCRTDRGNASVLRCSYHGWAYAKSGELVSAFAEDFYSKENLDKEASGLVPLGQISSYKGLIFGTWATDVPPLEKFLGDMRFYLDLLVGRTDAGTELIGMPQIWEGRSNWKLLAENSCDNQHLHTAHGSIVALGLLPPDPMALARGKLIATGGGHILHAVPGPPDPFFEYLGLPEELRPHLKRNLSEAQLAVARNTTYTVGNIFPNLSFIQVMIQGDPETPPTPFLNIRVFQPLGPDRTRVVSCLLIDREASPEYRKASLATYVRTFGPSGIFEQDDMENLEQCTRVSAGRIAQRHPLHQSMSLHVEPMKDFPGPGKVWPVSFGETAQLAFYDEWQRCLSTPTPWETAR